MVSNTWKEKKLRTDRQHLFNMPHNENQTNTRWLNYTTSDIINNATQISCVSQTPLHAPSSDRHSTEKRPKIHAAFQAALLLSSSSTHFHTKHWTMDILSSKI